jgi:6-phosphogluconolactonase
MFSIDGKGELEFETWVSTCGETPRDFGIDPTGRWLVAANQDSDSIVSFPLDPDTGRPSGQFASTLKCGTPVCILF